MMGPSPPYRCRFPSPLPSPSASISQPSAAVSDPPEEGGAEFLLFMYFTFWEGPIAYYLYAAETPIPSQVPDDTPPTMSPILEFLSEDHPNEMLCVELDSKLYFMGGRHWPWNYSQRQSPLSRDVYVFDAATWAAASRGSKNHGPSEGKELLKKGTPMNTGKPYPYAFAADGKIFMISARCCAEYSESELEKLSYIEVFDPDMNQWIIMPDPPMDDLLLTGHAVVDGKVFLASIDGMIYYCNLDSCSGWVSFSNYSLTSLKGFYGRADFVQDTLYVRSFDEELKSIVAFHGPDLPDQSHHHNDKPEELFRLKAFLPTEILEASYANILYSIGLTYFVHLGNRTFCDIVASNPPDPSDPRIPDSKRFHIQLVIFEAFKETYTEVVYGKEKTFFRANLKCSANHVALTGNGFPRSLHGCFSISLGRPASSVSQNVSVLDLSSKEKSGKPPRRRSIPAKSTGSPVPKIVGDITPILEARASSVPICGKNDSPVSDVSKSSMRKKLTSASYWLSQIDLSECAAKHTISLGFFKLALEAGCESLQRMRDELKSYAQRHKLVELGVPVKELFESYGISENCEQLQVSEICSQAPEEGTQSSDDDVHSSSSMTRTQKLKPKYGSTTQIATQVSSAKESAKNTRVDNQGMRTKGTWNRNSTDEKSGSVTAGRNASKKYWRPVRKNLLQAAREQGSANPCQANEALQANKENMNAPQVEEISLTEA